MQEGENLVFFSNSLPMKEDIPSQAGSHPTGPTLDNGHSESPIVVSWPSFCPSLLSSLPALLSLAPGLRLPLTEEEDFNLGPKHHQSAMMSLQDQIQVLMAQLQAMQAQLDSHTLVAIATPSTLAKLPKVATPHSKGPVMTLTGSRLNVDCICPCGPLSSRMRGVKSCSSSPT